MLPYGNTILLFCFLSIAMLRKITVLIAVGLTAVLSAGAQTYWTLEDCINYALKNNIAVQQSQVQLNIAGENLKQSQLNLLPSVNGQATNNYNFGRSIDPFTNTYAQQQIRSNAFSLNGSLTLFSGLQNQNTIKQQADTRKAAQEDLQATKNTISLNVANAFLQVVLNEELVRINTEQIKTTETQLDRVHKLVEAGSLPLNNEYDVRAQLASEKLNLVTAENQVKLAYLNLWQLMMYREAGENDKVKAPEITQDFENLPVYAPQTVYANFSATAPELQAAEYRIRSSQYALKVAQGGRSPRLALNASINTLYSESFRTFSGYTAVGSRVLYIDNTGTPVLVPYEVPTTSSVTPFSQQLNDNLGKFVGFNLSIPIFNGWQVNNNIKNARNNLSLSTLNHEQIENNVFREVSTAVTEYEAAKARYTSAKENVEAQKKSYEFATVRNESGLMNYAEYSVIKNNYQRAETSLAQAKYELLFRMKTIEFYNTGKITNQ